MSSPVHPEAAPALPEVVIHVQLFLVCVELARLRYKGGSAAAGGERSRLATPWQCRHGSHRGAVLLPCPADEYHCLCAVRPACTCLDNIGEAGPRRRCTLPPCVKRLLAKPPCRQASSVTREGASEFIGEKLLVASDLSTAAQLQPRPPVASSLHFKPCSGASLPCQNAKG